MERFIGRYREAFFKPDKRNGQVIFSYKPLPGAEDEIYRLIGDVTISMRAGDYLPMPELVTSLKLCYGIVDKIKFNRAPRSECPVRYFPKMSE